MADNLLAPFSYPVSEYTTPAEMQQERISQALGWDTSRPGVEFARRALTYLPLAMRSPAGARIGNEHAWAARTPPADTGGMPPSLAGLWMDSFNHFPATANSSTGLIRRHPDAFVPSGMLRATVTPDDMGFTGPSAPANTTRGWDRMGYLEAMERQGTPRPPEGWRVIPGGRGLNALLPFAGAAAGGYAATDDGY